MRVAELATTVRDAITVSRVFAEPYEEDGVTRHRRDHRRVSVPQVTRIRLAADLGSGLVEEVITGELFQVPTTAARFASRLAVVNAKFATGIPPTADQYEVIVVNR
jgi:hypothetical protein